MSAMPDILTYSSDDEPGITRVRRGKGFSYHDADGSLIECERVRARIEALGLPPAYEDVWICAHEWGHLQATGRDAAGRKQYRYHETWREYRDRQKFAGLVDFGEALPALRARVRRDLERADNGLRCVCAAIVRLLDRASLRVGSQAYARENGAHGATTLKTKQVKLSDGRLSLDFTAKGGKRVRKTIRDKTLARVLEDIGDLPGRELFRYIDDRGQIYGVSSAHVNDYIDNERESGHTAKTFRTWRGSVEALGAALDDPDGVTIKAMAERAARALHNTAAICRSSYIHPDIIALAQMEAEPRVRALNAVREAEASGLRRDEARLLALIG